MAVTVSVWGSSVSGGLMGLSGLRGPWGGGGWSTMARGIFVAGSGLRVEWCTAGKI